MHKPVPQRRGHPGRSPAVGVVVARSDDGPALGQTVFAQLAIQHQLIATGLYHGRRHIHFVQEEDARSALRQKLRCRLLRPAVTFQEGQAAKVNRIEQERPHVLQRDI